MTARNGTYVWRATAVTMVRLGRFIFRYRNIIGPLVFLIAVGLSRPRYPFGRADFNMLSDVAGALLALTGQALRIVTIGYEYIVRGGRNRQVYADRLVQGGMFAHSRNPLYFGNVLIAVGLGLVIHAHAFYLIALPSIILAYSAVIAAEEAYLRKQFGTEYETYANRVNRWWPRLTGFRRSMQGMRFNWQRVIAKEYSTTFILVAALVCLRVWSEYSVVGASALPSRNGALLALSLWAVLYLGVRALKKSGHISG